MGAEARPLAQAALQWTPTNPAVTCARPGAKDVTRIISNAEAAAGTPRPEDAGRLAGVSAGESYRAHPEHVALSDKHADRGGIRSRALQRGKPRQL